MKVLEVKHISKNFGGVKAVCDVSFSIDEQEIVGLIGPNGAGKTTCFNIISGFVKPDSGEIIFNNQDIASKPPEFIASQGVVRTFQISKPFHKLTVVENVLVGTLLKTNDIKEAKEISLGILELIGLSTDKDKFAYQLTVAGKKRLELARALATGPKVLLLDEVMAGLNPVEIDQMYYMILKLRASGLTLIIVEHIMQVIMNISDRIVVLNYGCKISEGSPQTVSKDPLVIEAYLGRRDNGC